MELKALNVAWNDEAEDLLKRASHNCDVLDLKNQVEQGASLFELSVDDVLIGYYILRVDHLANWSEAVFVAGAGSHPTIDVTTAAVLLVEKQVIGCKFLRIHTSRPGIVKKIVKLGYQPQEFIMMKELN